MVTVYSSPHKLCDKLQGLGEQLVPDNAHMSYESSMAALQRLVNIDASKSMCHLLPIMEGNYFQVVSLIAFLHFLE